MNVRKTGGRRFHVLEGLRSDATALFVVGNQYKGTADPSLTVKKLNGRCGSGLIHRFLLGGLKACSFRLPTARMRLLAAAILK